MYLTQTHYITVTLPSC